MLIRIDVLAWFALGWYACYVFRLWRRVLIQSRRIDRLRDAIRSSKTV